MKSVTSILVFLFVGISLHAQPAVKETGRGRGELGLTFSSFGSGNPVSFAKTVGGAGHRSNGFKAFGLAYVYKLNRTLDFETGLEYTAYKIINEPYLPLIYHGTATLTRFSLINIPVSVRFSFLKYLSLSGGAFLDIGSGTPGSIDSQKGIGANLGTGICYNFKGRLTVFASPYIKMHSLFLASDIGERLLESGLRFGFMVRLD